MDWPKASSLALTLSLLSSFHELLDIIFLVVSMWEENLCLNHRDSNVG